MLCRGGGSSDAQVRSEDRPCCRVRTPLAAAAAPTFERTGMGSPCRASRAQKGPICGEKRTARRGRIARRRVAGATSTAGAPVRSGGGAVSCGAMNTFLNCTDLGNFLARSQSRLHFGIERTSAARAGDRCAVGREASTRPSLSGSGSSPLPKLAGVSGRHSGKLNGSGSFASAVMVPSSSRTYSQRGLLRRRAATFTRIVVGPLTRYSARNQSLRGGRGWRATCAPATPRSS